MTDQPSSEQAVATTVTAADVKRLREATQAPMMACKEALVDADGDFERAVELVRERTGARMDARVAERTATEGLVHAYLHTPTPGAPAKVGVLLELSCETDFVARSDEFQRLANDLALHIAAMWPRWISEADVDDDELARERELARQQAAAENKPPHVVDRIVEGKVARFYEESVLEDQAFVKDESRTVAEVISEVQGVLGEKIAVSRFVRFEVGS